MAIKLIKFINNKVDSSPATVKSVEGLLTQIVTDDAEKSDFIEKIKHQFPLQSAIHVSATKVALQKFKTIDNRKIDLNLSLKDLDNIKLKRVGETSYQLYLDVLSPNNDGKVSMQGVKTIYNAKNMFLDKFMGLSVATEFACQYGEKEKIESLICEYQSNKKVNQHEKKLRFIEDESKMCLRSVVGSNYKAYDNGMVLYIAIAILSNLTEKMNINFELDNMVATDSDLVVNFFSSDIIKINEDVTVQVGLRLKNNELGEGAAKFEAVYRITNLKNQRRFTVIEKEIASINHGYNPEKVSSKLIALKNFDRQIRDIVSTVKEIVWSKRLTLNDMNWIIMKISGLKKDMPQEIKHSIIQQLDAVQVVDETFTILDLFDKLESLIEKDTPEVRERFEALFSAWIRKLNRENIV